MPDAFRVEIETTFLRFNPNDSKFLKKIQAEIPAFAAYESDFARTDAGKLRLFAWITIMYDLHTPLRREIKDLYKRKVYAGSLCGINPHMVTGKYRECFEKIFTGQDREVNDLIVKFITSFHNPEYTQLMAHVAIQESALDKIVAGKADKNTQFMFDAATDKIKDLTNIVYGSGVRDEVFEARRALYKQVAYDLSSLRPENVARTMLAEGKLPDEWNPYEKGYEPDDMKFVGDDPDIAKEDEEVLP